MEKDEPMMTAVSVNTIFIAITLKYPHVINLNKIILRHEEHNAIFELMYVSRQIVQVEKIPKIPTLTVNFNHILFAVAVMGRSILLVVRRTATTASIALAFKDA